VLRLSGNSADLRALVLLALLPAALSACSRPLTQEECSRLLDHYVELLMRSDRPNAPAEEIVRLQSEARAKAAQDPEFASCATEVSRSQFECAMGASDADRVEQCLL
jgi:hypothetical protein